jgi:hypothetical protein
MELDYVLHDRQAKAGATQFTGASPVYTVESFGKAGDVSFRDALAGVGNR